MMRRGQFERVPKKGQEVTDQWYSEIKVHTFGAEPSSLKSGHFTQVVWKGSQEVGVGKATAKDGKVIVVANYRPAGNMMGKFTDNVQAPNDGKIVLPVEKAKDSGAGTPFSSRMGDDPFGGARGCGGGGTERRTTRTYTTTEGSGPNAVTKTIVEETVIKPDGSKVTTKKETVTTGGAAPSQFKGDDFGRLSLQDDAHQTSGFKSSPSSSPKKPQKMSDFIEEAIKVHNELRKKHGSDKLKHDKNLSEFAQSWAEHLAANDAFKHSDCLLKGERIGENICCKWSSSGADYTGREACEQWYSEINKHDFSRETTSLGSGHFTQMVWKGSTHMGIGKAKTAGGKVIVVANYKPAGNMIGKFMDNVKPPKN